MSTDPQEQRQADIDLLYDAVMRAVDHCVWASTGGHAAGTPAEEQQLAGARMVAEYLTRGSLRAHIAAALDDPCIGQWEATR